MALSNFSKFFIASTLLVMGVFVACRGPVGPQGPAGPLGDDTEFVEIEVGASRTYNPSSWNNEEFDLEPGFYSLPMILEVVEGNAGTGWASIIHSGIRYCYQGIAGNNNQLGTEFAYKGTVPVNKECFQKRPKFSSLTFFSGETIEVQVNGGGCGNFCVDTEVVGTLEALLE